jgi:hypothetical protein
MIIRDFYFGAWAIVEKGVNYTISDGKLELEVNTVYLNELKEEYAQTRKVLFDKVRLLIRQVNESR